MRPDADRYQRLRAIFAEGMRMPPSARDAYLEQACADDGALRSELQRLLAAHEEAGMFLEQSGERQHPPVPTTRSSPARIASPCSAVLAPVAWAWCTKSRITPAATSWP